MGGLGVGTVSDGRRRGRPVRHTNSLKKKNLSDPCGNRRDSHPKSPDPHSGVR